ncbi:hypothetical protein [Sphingobacterium sp.]|nr:hypothetical protein [Sphingobacterium sp.]
MTKKRKEGAGKYSNVILNQLIDLVCFIPRCYVPQHDKKRGKKVHENTPM